MVSDNGTPVKRNCPSTLSNQKKAPGMLRTSSGNRANPSPVCRCNCGALVLQVPAVSTVKKRLGPRVDIPSMDLFKLSQPSRGQHPTGTRANQNQLFPGHRLRDQPIGDLRRGRRPAVPRPPRPQMPVPSTRYVHTGILSMVQTLILRKHEYLGLNVHLCFDGVTGFEG